ncbi:hypothetical protein ACFRNJ_12400 [Streptomyces sp. NPDC056721]|uniref:hypothetical protein n=1 Tax=Streptomyces sp. NPDC056721 TaxID=3345923 RepID=UPI0036C934C7
MSLNTSEAAASPFTPVEISLSEAKDLLARAVEKKGAGYIYEMPVVETHSGGVDQMCAYFDPKTGAPSCLVGQVLAGKGFTYERMQFLDANTYTSAGTLADTDVIKVDNETRALLEIVQSEQDQGMTWGLALEEALALYEEAALRYDTDGYDAALPF